MIDCIKFKSHTDIQKSDFVYYFGKISSNFILRNTIQKIKLAELKYHQKKFNDLTFW